jgi:hypothetical protein
MLLVDDREAIAKMEPLYEQPRATTQVRLCNYSRRSKGQLIAT